MRAYDAAMAASWAMLPEAIEQLLDIASRENDATPEALEAYRAARADTGERLSVRGNVGILEARGPMFKRANLMTAFSGATSYETLRRDLQVALDDRAVQAIMLRVDSPGGEVSACDELAAALFDARSQKPIWAYVSGQGASAAYWLASATDRIVVSDSAVVGSIGVVLGITDRKKADERSGVSRLEFVSSQSPDKRPDHETDAGKAKIQKLVDDLGAVFVNAVAKYRGVTADHVVKNFGAGGVEVGANAVARGMADEVGQFEAALRKLSARASKTQRQLSSPAIKPIAPMSSVLATAISAGDTPGSEIAIANLRRGMRAICAIEHSSPRLHALLRDELAVSADEADKILTAMTKDVAEASSHHSESDYLARKARAGALGLEWHPEYPKQLAR